MLESLCSKSIVWNNTSVCLISLNNLVKYRQRIKLPPIQRLEISGKVQEIIRFQDLYYKKHGHFHFNPLTLHEFKDEYYLTDGQHRFKAIQHLLLNKDYHETTSEIFIHIRKVNTIQEMEEDYKMLNKHTECPEFPFGVDEDIVKETTKHFIQMHPKAWKQTKRLHRPYLNQTKFQEGVAFLLNELLKSTKDLKSSHLIKIIEERNSVLQKWDIHVFNKKKKLSENQKKTLLDKCRNECNGLRLGMYPNTSQEYVYDWISDIIHDQTGERMTKRNNKRKRKTTIPKIVKEKVWNTYMGNAIKAKCWVCNESEISPFKFTCGHIIAEKNGGTLDIANLRPVCTECNSRVGTQNMKEYKNLHYPKKSTFFHKIKQRVSK